MSVDHSAEGSQFLSPEQMPFGRTGRAINWNGWVIPVERAYSPKILNAFRNRILEKRAIIIGCTGEQGLGKSYMAQRIGRMLDPHFTVRNIVFDRDGLLHLIGEDSPLDRGSVILIDESQYVMNSRSWAKSLQQEIISQIESLRFKGYVLIVVAIHIGLLDNVMRNNLLNYHIHVEERGKGVVYEMYQNRFEFDVRRKRLGVLRLNLPDWEECKSTESCLTCRYSGLYPKTLWADRANWLTKGTEICETTRAKYERKKRLYVDGESRRLSDDQKTKKETKEAKKLTDYDMARLLLGNEAILEKGNKHPFTPASVAAYLRKTVGMKVGEHRAYSIMHEYEQIVIGMGGVAEK